MRTTAATSVATVWAVAFWASGCMRVSQSAASPAPAAVAQVKSAEAAPSIPSVTMGPEAEVRRLGSSHVCELQQLPPHGEAVTSSPGERTYRRGSVDKEDVRQAIRANLDAVRACYEAILVGARPYPQGKVRVRFAFDAAGVVRHSCMVESTLKNEYCERCVADAVLRWRNLPKPVGGGWVVVDYPFVFVPADDQK